MGRPYPGSERGVDDLPGASVHGAVRHQLVALAASHFPSWVRIL
ncbi:hypothetical protein ACFVY1_48110 [Streptomyces sp. NPDC058293]